MYTLVLASQKGGSGKTTLSGHLAVQAQLSGAGPVALIDTDPQGSLAQWWNSREAEEPYLAKVGLFDLADGLAQLERAGFKLVVIDTPPAITPSISQVVSHADLVIIPARPSPHDLRAVGATADIAARHEKSVIFVINGATARARITGEAAVALSQHGTVAPVILNNRVDFAASMVDGRTVGEVVPNSASSGEVRDLWTYVQDRLFRLKRDPAIRPEFLTEHLSVKALSALDEMAPREDDEDSAEEAAEAPPAILEQPPVEPLQVQPPVSGRRIVFERRPLRSVSFGGGDRRNHPFGRRASDQHTK